MQHVTRSRSNGSWSGVRERPRYFPRQLMTPDELTLEADYFRDRLRRHNVYLHGWGVVCGAVVCVVLDKSGGTTPWVVQVQPGYVLGPYGDEIMIDSACEVSLQGNATVADPDDADDVWCTEVHVEQRDGPRFVAVRYREVSARPVRAQPAGCGCDETPCEYSRYCDGYEIGVLDACPDSHRPPKGDPATGNPACPPVPDSPWVVLAEVTLDGDGTITKIDNCACRRIVASARESWRTCESTEADHPAPQDEAQPADSADGNEPEPPAADGEGGAGGDGGGSARPRARQSARTTRRRSSGSQG